MLRQRRLPNMRPLRRNTRLPACRVALSPDTTISNRRWQDRSTGQDRQRGARAVDRGGAKSTRRGYPSTD